MCTDCLRVEKEKTEKERKKEQFSKSASNTKLSTKKKGAATLAPQEKMDTEVFLKNEVTTQYFV